MNVLICGASNAIAINVARLLHDTGHTAVLADSDRYARAFFSRYCLKKCLMRDPLTDRQGFSDELEACIKKEAINLIVPTTDEALLNLLEVQDVIRGNVMTTFPLDSMKVKYVLDKANLPELCANAGVKTPSTLQADEDFAVAKADGLLTPMAIKKRIGVAGEGFMRVDDRGMLCHALASVRRRFPASSLLIQEYIAGSVYGAGGLFDGKTLRQFYSYKYVRRHPRLSGSPTICQQQHLELLKEAMGRVLTALDWNGYCHMDFIIEEKSGLPFLTDINPVHWYTVPFSDDLSSLACYLGEAGRPELKRPPFSACTSFGLLRELQRILGGGILGEDSSGGSEGYWEYCKHLRLTDFYWDPLPVVLSPILKFLRFARGSCGGA